MKPILISLLAALLCTLFSKPVFSQEYKIRQSSAVMGMKIETTVYVKGMRKRTESAAIMGMTQPVTIEQCDLQRTIKINDKKKLYFIDSFYKTQQEVIDEDEPQAKKPVTAVKEKNTKAPEKGGVITIYYSIRDTGERKKNVRPYRPPRMDHPEDETLAGCLYDEGQHSRKNRWLVY